MCVCRYIHMYAYIQPCFEEWVQTKSNYDKSWKLWFYSGGSIFTLEELSISCTMMLLILFPNSWHIRVCILGLFIVQHILKKTLKLKNKKNARIRLKVRKELILHRWWVSLHLLWTATWDDSKIYVQCTEQDSLQL